MAQQFFNAVYQKLASFFAGPFSSLERGGFVLLLRLENMPLLADRLGQVGMTHLLMQLSLRLGAAIRSQDPVQILSPGVFAVTLRSRSVNDAMAIAIRMQQCGQAQLAAAGQTFTPVLTGILTPDNIKKPSEIAEIMHRGHQKLLGLHAKHLGQISMIDLSHDGQDQPLPISVMQAAEMGQLIAYFHPKLCCHTGGITGFEILARWKHPTKGLLLPADFTPGMSGAEHQALTFAMLEQAMMALTSWKASGYTVPTVSINISINELNDPKFAELILKEIELHGHAPEELIIEVLESIAPIHTNDAAHMNLRRLRDAGCQLDLDDFGTGFAGLDAVRTFGVRRIKIDRSFVTGCQNSPEQQRMILGIFALAEQLGVTTIAEGVETAEEHSFLAQIGCCEVQGFAIARPMPFNETFTFLKNQKRLQQELPDLPIRKNGGQ